MKEGTPMVERSNNTGNNHERDGYELRAALVEQWRIAPIEITEYQGGEATDADGNLYPFAAGRRLLIDGVRVMDTCETPWCEGTVNALFKDLKAEKPKALIRGFGLGIDSNLVFQRLVGTGGGELHIIELNHGIARQARAWKERRIRMIGRMGQEVSSTQPDIGIFIHEGDAFEVTRRLEEEGRKFDIIISDTYPLSEDEEGINDLMDLDILKRTLESEGKFAFFAHTKDSSGGLLTKQRDPVNRHFINYSVSEVAVNPPPDDDYLHTEEGNPVRRLPIVVCSNPKL